MTQEQVDNLLKPRIKVIANYYQGVPGISNNKIRIGDIFMNLIPQQDIVWRRFKDARFDDETIHTPYEYPHLFRKLEWWEDRTPEEMPEYVKLSPETTDADGDDNRVFKVTALRKSDDGIMMICYADDPNDGDPFDPFNHPKYFLPATATEYLNYQQSKPKQ